MTRSTGEKHMTDLVRVSVLAHKMGINERTIYRWIKKGLIPSVKLGPRSIRVPRDYLTDVLEKAKAERSSAAD